MKSGSVHADHTRIRGFAKRTKKRREGDPNEIIKKTFLELKVLCCRLKVPSPVDGSIPSLRHVTVKFQNVSTETGPGSSQKDENRRRANRESKQQHWNLTESSAFQSVQENFQPKVLYQSKLTAPWEGGLTVF